ncbi:histidine phosphatase family protein, partial [Candidatus Pelagibacter sp.]|nr:histidine phosphatase family protein [Candidatus Pelagibacter sp.]
MKKYIIFFSLIIIFCSDKGYSKEKVIESLKEGRKIIFIRHAYAPGNGDPENFNLEDCRTQRNLDETGIAQSKKIGLIFKKNEIKIDKVLSSEWCRCKDTAKYAFQNFESFEYLNSFYDKKFIKNKDKQIKNLKNYINNWNSEKNLILVTHFVVISEILNISSSSGEIIVSN